MMPEGHSKAVFFPKPAFHVDWSETEEPNTQYVIYAHLGSVEECALPSHDL